MTVHKLTKEELVELLKLHQEARECDGKYPPHGKFMPGSKPEEAHFHHWADGSLKLRSPTYEALHKYERFAKMLLDKATALLSRAESVFEMIEGIDAAIEYEEDGRLTRVGAVMALVAQRDRLREELKEARGVAARKTTPREWEWACEILALRLTEEGDPMQQLMLDKKTREMAREILEGQNPKTLEEAKRFAQNWIETAAQHARNEEYWEKRAREAEAKLNEVPCADCGAEIVRDPSRSVQRCDSCEANLPAQPKSPMRMSSE